MLCLSSTIGKIRQKGLPGFYLYEVQAKMMRMYVNFISDKN